VSNEKLIASARDELFSHINRCGVLQASAEDQTTWMDETIDYIGERYPELGSDDLKDLHAVGMRFCQPTINNISKSAPAEEPEVETESVEDEEEAVTAGVGAEDGEGASA